MTFLGVNYPPVWIGYAGLFLFAVLGLQVLVGLRKIKLGRDHLKWHKRIGIALVVLAALHGLGGLDLLGVVRL